MRYLRLPRASMIAAAPRQALQAAEALMYSHITDALLRFLIGGTLISGFAALGDLFRPKSFAGVFAAAPSLALATLILTISREGTAHAGVEARSMIAGAIGFTVYAWTTSRWLRRYRVHAATAASVLILVWLSVSLSLRAVLTR